MKAYIGIFPEVESQTEYRRLLEFDIAQDEDFIRIPQNALKTLAFNAFSDIAFYFTQSHIDDLKRIACDDFASDNDRFTAASLLENARISSEGKLPLCQDTGTAIVIAEKGERILSIGDRDELSLGAKEAYLKRNLRYSQIVPSSMFEEKNSEDNSPSFVEIHACEGEEYRLLFVAKGGGSSNKTALYQQTKSLLNPSSLKDFLKEKILLIGVGGCPPYHIGVAIGGLTPQQTVTASRLASYGVYDFYNGDMPLRDTETEEYIKEVCIQSGLGSQFGGKYFSLAVKVLRFPRHAASCPVAISVSCNAHRVAKAKINKDGVFLEKMCREVEIDEKLLARILQNKGVSIDIDRNISALLKDFSKLKAGDRVSITGTLIVARDSAHAALLKKLEEEGSLPSYFRNHPIYYAGPAKTPDGFVSGSFGPTTASRMDVYVPRFMKEGASLIMLAKGERTKEVRDSIVKYGGCALGTIGGAAALVAKSIKESEIVDFEEFGMEAVRRIRVENLTCFVVCDSSGGYLYGM